MLAASDAGRADDAHAAFAQARELAAQRVGARHLAGQGFAYAHGQRSRRFLAFLHDIEVVIERRDFIDLGHREAQLAGERHQMRRGQVSVAILDPVQEFDQQIAPAGRVAEQRGDVRGRLRRRARAPWAGCAGRASCPGAKCRRRRSRSWNALISVIDNSCEKVAILLDVRGKVERMLADQSLGELGVAALERLDDAHVIDDRARGAVGLRNRHPANRAHVDEQVLDRLAHEMRARQPDDRLVERDIGVGVLVDVLGRRRIAEFVEHRAQAGDVLVARVDGGKPRGHALERRPHLDHLDDLLFRLAHDEDAAAGDRAQQAFLLEQRHRLADRRAAHAQRHRQLPLVEAHLAGVRIDIGVDDRLLERRVRLVAEAHVGVERLQHQRHRRGGRSQGGGHGGHILRQIVGGPTSGQERGESGRRGRQPGVATLEALCVVYLIYQKTVLAYLLASNRGCTPRIGAARRQNMPQCTIAPRPRNRR